MSTEFINDQWRLPNAFNGTESNVNKQSNYSMDFNINDSIAVNGTSLQFSGSTSFALWFKMDGSITSSQRNMIGKGLEPNLSFFIRVNNLNNIPKIRFTIQESGGAYVSIFDSSSPTVTADVWHHVVGVFDVNNNQLKLYYDGTEVSGSPVSLGGATNIKNVNSDLKIGVYDNNFYDFYGQIDAVAIFNYALSSSQITTLYGLSSTGIGNPMSLSPKPVAYYPLGDQDAFNGADYLVPNSSLKDYVFDFIPNDYITTGFTLPSDSTMTFSFWANLNSTILSDSHILDDLNSGASARRLAIYFNATGSGELRVSVKNASGSTDKLEHSLSGITYVNAWNNYVISLNGTTCKLYINGSLVDTETLSVAFGDAGVLPLVIARAGAYNGGYYNGKLSNVQIFNTELPATGSNSVETLYNNGSPLTSMTGFTSLVSWYKLNASDTYDGTNWTIEDHAGSNDGTSSGMTQANLVQSDLSFKTSYSPYALSFDAAGTDRINFGNPTNLQITSSFSVSVWINQTTQQDSIVISKDAFGTDRCWSLWSNGYQSNNFVIFSIFDSSNTYFNVFSNIRVDDGKWHHLTAVYEAGNSVKIYIDGSLNNTNSTSIPSSIANKNADIILGESHTSGYYEFGGSISNCSIWNTALTSSQVTELYSEGIPQNLNNHSAVSSLVSWWQLGSNSSFNTNWTVLDEVTASGNNGTSVNMGEDSIVDGVNSYANGVSSGMSDNIVGSAPFSDANSLSYNMDVLDRVEDTPS